MDTRIKFEDKFLPEVTDEAPRVFTRTETVEEFVARGGQITKLPKREILWSYRVRITGRSSQKGMIYPANVEAEE